MVDFDVCLGHATPAIVASGNFVLFVPFIDRHHRLLFGSKHASEAKSAYEKDRYQCCFFLRDDDV